MTAPHHTSSACGPMVGAGRACLDAAQALGAWGFCVVLSEAVRELGGTSESPLSQAWENPSAPATTSL
ncbi:MAG: hypothetical protein AAF913_11515 [Pseudomonadota bacterium]